MTFALHRASSAVFVGLVALACASSADRPPSELGAQHSPEKTSGDEAAPAEAGNSVTTTAPDGTTPREKYATHPTAGIALHVEPQTGFLAPLPDTEALSCEALSARSPFTGANAVHVLAVGFAGVTAAQFGIRYPETMSVATWRAAGSGIEIPSEDWPASGSWIAVAFGNAQESSSGIVHLGTLSIKPGGVGLLEIIGVRDDDDRIVLVDAARTEWNVDAPARVATAAIRVEGERQPPCE